MGQKYHRFRVILFQALQNILSYSPYPSQVLEVLRVPLFIPDQWLMAWSIQVRER